MVLFFSMKLIFLYGPPAVGKLTIAKILQKKTGYTLLHNHLLQNPITEVFSFENPANRLLVREFRLRMFAEAVKSNLNLIATFGIAGNNPFDHITDVLNTIASHLGEVCLVHLTADKETILSRAENQSRKEQGKQLSKEQLTAMLQENPDMFGVYPNKPHLTIDTTQVSPKEAAEKIIAYYQL